MFKNILKKATHYGLVYFSIVGFLLWLTEPIIYRFAWMPITRQIVNIFNLTEDTNHKILYVILFTLWSICYFLYLKYTLYTDITDRNYLIDHHKYRMGWFELVNYFKDADDKRIREEELPIEDWKTADGVILGHVKNRLVKRDSDAPGNIALFSLPGGGKTTSQIIPSAMRFGGSVLCIDIKGDVLHAVRKNTRRRIRIFAPDDASISCSFNPLGGIKTMNLTERKAFIENLGFALVPDEPGDNSKYFVDGARAFWNGIALFLLDQNINTSFSEIVDSILTSDPFTWITQIKDSTCYEAKIFTDSLYGANEKNITGQYNKICSSLRPFTNGDLKELLGDKKAITPDMLDHGYDIYIEIPQDKIQMYAPITTIIVQNFMMYFMGRQDSSSGAKLRPILFLLDEFPQLNFSIDILLSAMETLRSKKVTLFIAQQSLASLSRRYTKDGCREIIDNCAYISVMSAQDPESREFFQKLIGTRKILKIGQSDTTQANGGSFSKSVQEARDYVFQPETFGCLNDHVIIAGNGKYILAEKCYYFK